MSDESDEEYSSLHTQLQTISSGSVLSVLTFFIEQVLVGLFAWLITSTVGPAGYGTVTSVLSSIRYISSLLRGVQTTLLRTLPRYSPSTQNTLIFISYGLVSIISTVLAIVGFIYRDSLASYTEFQIGNPSLSILVALLLVGYSVLLIPPSVFKSFKQIGYARLVKIGGSNVSNLIFVGLFILLFDATVLTVFGALTVAVFVSIVLSTAFLLYYSSFSIQNISFSRDPIADFMSYVGEASIGNVFSTTQVASYGIFMLWFLSPVSAGAFSISMLLSELIRWPLSGVNQIFPTIATELYEDEKIESIQVIFTSTSRVIVAISFPLTSVLILYRHHILGLFASEYGQFADILLLLSIGTLFAVSAGSVGLLLYMMDNERVMLFIQFGLAVIALTASYTLTSKYDYLGLAISVTLLLVLNNVLELIVLYYTDNIHPYSREHLSLLSIFCVVFGFQYFFVDVTTIFVSVPVVIGTSIGYWIYSYRYILTELDKDLLNYCGAVFISWKKMLL